MTLNTITPEDKIFNNEDALRDHYPERILERDDVLAQYLNTFRQVIRNKRPTNAFVYGDTGVGKTIGTKAVFETLHKSIEEWDYKNSKFDEPSLKTVHLECKDMNTSYQVACHLINEFRKNVDNRDSISATGYPESEIYLMLVVG